MRIYKSLMADLKKIGSERSETDLKTTSRQFKTASAVLDETKEKPVQDRSVLIDLLSVKGLENIPMKISIPQYSISEDLSSPMDTFLLQKKRQIYSSRSTQDSQILKKMDLANSENDLV